MSPIATFATEPLFHIGMRALEQPKVGDLQAAAKGRGSGCLSLSGGTGIRYCPWCGATLAKFYGDTWRELLDERITHELGLPTA
jgi:hypothetical protein